MALDAADFGTLSVLAPYDGSERAGFERVLAAFTEETGIAVDYEVLTDDAVLEAMIENGDLPDIAVSSRPGDIGEYYRRNVYVSLPESGANMDLLRTAYSDTALRLGLIDGDFVGLPISASPKSTVWYRPTSFTERSLAVPRTLDEWLAVMSDMAAGGDVPLSIGGESGWSLTDWFENIYLRVVGPEGYDELFRTHEISWTDASVVQAMEILRELWAPTDERVFGGAVGALDTEWNEAIEPYVAGDAEMYALGGFLGGVIADSSPELTFGDDFDYFAFPDIDPQFSGAQMLGADFAIALNADPETGRFLEFMAGAEAAVTWANADEGARIVPSLTADISAVDAPITKQLARTIRESQIVVFDGSDIAPPSVGGDAMFTALQEFLADPDDIMGPLEDIEAAAVAAYGS